MWPGSLFAVIALTVATVVFVSPPAAHAAPVFQLPFPCNQTWNGNSSASPVHQSWEIDFNRGSSASADLGDTVVAAAEGTVLTSAYQRSSGYGNLVKIKHADGYLTFYAHLNTRAVVAGQYVSRGQAIGTVGNTSRPGKAIRPHLHFEVRNGRTYPGNVRKAVFNGRSFPYPEADVTSRNCPSPYDPAELCGGGYQVIDTARLSNRGSVNLMWNGSRRSNWVVTLKYASLGRGTATSAYLQPSGTSRRVDSGNFGYYAGPMAGNAPGCIRWGGAIGGRSYDSSLEHC
jgi:hypothetical protein